MCVCVCVYVCVCVKEMCVYSSRTSNSMCCSIAVLVHLQEVCVGLHVGARAVCMCMCVCVCAFVFV